MATLAPASHLRGDLPSASTPQAEQDRRELAFVAMERTRMPMVVTDPRLPGNPIVLANRSFLEETGYRSDEVLGRNCRFMQGPGTDRATVDRVRSALEAEREITVELLNYRKDGSTFWNQLYISPIHDDEGRLLYFFASQWDVTRRREADQLEAAEHLLLREVDHRSKNALAQVQAIVRLTRRDDPSTFADLVQERVDALARAHATLADAHWREVPLERVVRGELKPFGVRRVRLKGQQVSLPPAQVQPAALLLHEMAANAKRHGALSVDEGVLSVAWQADPATREIRLEWHESGGPPPPARIQPGYGHTMIAAIAARQLGGSVQYDWRGTGLIAAITIAGKELSG